MNILYVTQYFHPEVCAPTNRALANTKFLAKKGHTVTVLTEMPNHPKGIIKKGYKGKIFCKEKLSGINILRTWVYTNPQKNYITRILFYATFMLSGIIAILLNWRKFEIIYVSSPPLFVGGIGVFLKKLFPNSKFIFEIRDLWPDAAIDMGELNNKLAIKVSKKFERKCYENADRIITVTKYFRTKICKKGIPPQIISVVRNGTDIKKWRRKTEIECPFPLANNKFTVIYAGNFGLAQGLETILLAAKELSNRQDISIILIGDGPERDLLLKKKKELQLTNVKFIDEVPTDKISSYLSSADCGIVPLVKSEVFKGTIPSKIFDYMACELPILLGVDGEARDIIEKSKGGLYFEPENFIDLAKKILFMQENKEFRQNMKKQGYKYIIKNFDRERKADKIEKILIKMRK